MNFLEAQFWDAVSNDEASPSTLLALQDSGPQTGSASAGRGGARARPRVCVKASVPEPGRRGLWLGKVEPRRALRPELLG